MDARKNNGVPSEDNTPQYKSLCKSKIRDTNRISVKSFKELLESRYFSHQEKAIIQLLADGIPRDTRSIAIELGTFPSSITQAIRSLRLNHFIVLADEWVNPTTRQKAQRWTVSKMLFTPKQQGLF